MSTIAERILAAVDLPPQPVEIPEWGIKKGEAFQRGMGGRDRRRWEMCFARNELGELLNPEDEPRSLAVGSTLIDAQGARIFSDEQIERLADKNAAVLDRLYDGALILSGIRSRSQIEGDIKNYGETSGSDSSSV